MTRRHLHVPDRLWAALSARAAAEGVPVAEIVRRVLAEWAKLNKETPDAE